MSYLRRQILDGFFFHLMAIYKNRFKSSILQKNTVVTENLLKPLCCRDVVCFISILYVGGVANRWRLYQYKFSCVFTVPYGNNEKLPYHTKTRTMFCSESELPFSILNILNRSLPHWSFLFSKTGALSLRGTINCRIHISFVSNNKHTTGKITQNNRRFSVQRACVILTPTEKHKL